MVVRNDLKDITNNIQVNGTKIERPTTFAKLGVWSLKSIEVSWKQKGQSSKISIHGKEKRLTSKQISSEITKSFAKSFVCSTLLHASERFAFFTLLWKVPLFRWHWEEWKKPHGNNGITYIPEDDKGELDWYQIYQCEDKSTRTGNCWRKWKWGKLHHWTELINKCHRTASSPT